jgi:hypothetical protein
VILGAIVGSADYLLRRRRERKAAAKEIGFGDDENTLLGKLLQLNPRVKPGQAIVVRLKNGEKYMGSLFSYSETITSLVGWFKINLEGQSPEFLKKMKTLQRNGQLYGLFSAAQQYGLEVKLDDAIQQWMEDDYDNTGDGSKQWNNDEVAEITVEPEGKSGLPLRLVE